MSIVVKDPLHEIAKRLIWWKSPEESLRQKTMLLAQVMTLGTWNDIQTIRSVYGDDAFKTTLQQTPAGIFDARSWNYWHGFYHLHPIPPLPQRKFE